MSSGCTTYKEHYVSLDSRHRNRIQWPSSSQYQISISSNIFFDGTPPDSYYKSVRTVEVIDVTYPNRNNVVNEMYLFLCIPEIGGVFDATSSTGSNAIAKLVPTKLMGEYAFVQYEKSQRPYKCFNFATSKEISTLTVEFRKNDGTLFNFGTENTSNEPLNPVLQTNVTLRVCTQW
jgi:hypothetical protein